MQKIIYIPPLFPQLLQRYCKLVIFVLWEARPRPPKAIAEILHSKESCILIGQEHFGQ